MKDILKPKGRLAHSSENRVGQAWKSGSVQVIGEDIFGNVKLIDMPAGNFQCPYCLHLISQNQLPKDTDVVVRNDRRLFAACPVCGTLFNDGNPAGEKTSNRERKRQLEKLKYDSRHNIG